MAPFFVGLFAVWSPFVLRVSLKLRSRARLKLRGRRKAKLRGFGAVLSKSLAAGSTGSSLVCGKICVDGGLDDGSTVNLSNDSNK